uniref:Uncharacterized protein n=2 Tax=Oryza sativa subsp. japonica TaxID=39947 RepID=Q2R8L7_ORYSJ|nr:hypothetical protein [Oryza sativa Japonica Group]ABA92202.1 hypothetical protein LOC_Os11g11750 [Oryza sativa Japonica Group]
MASKLVGEDGDGGDEDGGDDRWWRQWGSDLVEDGVGGGEDRWRRWRGTVGEDGGTAGRISWSRRTARASGREEGWRECGEKRAGARKPEGQGVLGSWSTIGARWCGRIGASGASIWCEDPRKHVSRSIVQDSPPPLGTF